MSEGKEVCGAKSDRGNVCELPRGHKGFHREADAEWVLGCTPWEPIDAVSHPQHYTAGRKFEPAEVIIDWQLSWALGNVVKYLARAGRKGDAIEDLKKARWYLDREIRRLEETK